MQPTRGQVEIVKDLLEKYNADFSILNKNSCSALHFACWNGQTELASILLKFASTRLSKERFSEFPNQRNEWGKTAFMDTTDRDHLLIVKLLLEQQYAAEYRIPNNNDAAPLHGLSWNSFKKVAALLLKTASEDLTPEHFQAFINYRNKWGQNRPHGRRRKE